MGFFLTFRLAITFFFFCTFFPPNFEKNFFFELIFQSSPNYSRELMNGKCKAILKKIFFVCGERKLAR